MSGQRISDATKSRILAAWPGILAALADGELVRDALEDVGISRGMLRAYLDGDAGARTQWDSAREQSAHAFMEQAIEAANNRGLDPAHARVRIDTLKWAARIRNPRLYGDKAQLDVNVRTIDLTRIIEAANQRLAAANAGRIIDGQVLRAGLPAELANLV